jgi:tocopherol O-methyltransferase
MVVQTAELKEGIAKFYDKSSGLWEDMWGDHMHHGYYPKDGPAKSNQEAQIDMINESLKWAGVTSAKKARKTLFHCGIGLQLRFPTMTDYQAPIQ